MATSNSVRPLRSWQRNSHPLEFSDAISQINAAVRKGLPTSRVAYEKVSVLMMHWDSDDIGVIPLERELGNVFRVIFRFVIEYYEIEASPLSHNPTQNLQNRLIKFRTDHQGDRNLLIYVYSGHASAGASSFACDILCVSFVSGFGVHG